MDSETVSLVRALSTQIGIIMEDSATKALIWTKEDQLTPLQRLQGLQRSALDMVRLADAALSIFRRGEPQVSH